MKRTVISSILLGIIFIIIGSCSSGRSDCAQEMIDDFIEMNEGRSFLFILEFEQDGETYLIFDNGIAFDAIATVVDENCQEVCRYGGFRPSGGAPCEEFQEGINRARQIWPD